MASTRNGIGQGQRFAFDGHLSLLHGLQQRGLGLGRGAVDLIGQDDVGKDRALAQLEGVLGAVEDVSAGDVAGQQIGCELDALEFQPEHFGKAAGHQGLAQAREVFQQDVPACQHGRHHHFEQVALAHHGPLHFGNHLAA